MNKLCQTLKNFFTSRRFKYGSNSIILTLFFIGILIMINLLVDSRLKWKIDLTKGKQYSLTSQSIDFVRGINKDVKITCFYNMGEEPSNIVNILNEYKNNNNKISVRFIDPDKEPVVAVAYAQGGNIKQGSVVVESGNRKRIIGPAEFYDIKYYSNSFEPLFSKVEQKITSAVSYVVSEQDFTLYFLQGHGEMVLQELNTLTGILEGINYNIEELKLINVEEVPSNANILMVMAPKTDISIEDRDKLTRYIDNGGRMMLCLDAFAGASENGLQKLANFNTLLEGYGIRVGDAVIIEKDSTMGRYNEPFTLIPKMQDTDITENIILKNLDIVFNMVRNIEILDTNNNVVTQAIANTSASAWGETNFKKPAIKDNEDVHGPLNVAVSVLKSAESETGKDTRILVLGNASFLSDTAPTGINVYGNYDLLINSINWLEQQKDSIVIPAKDITEEYFMVSSAQAKLIFAIVLLIPVIILGGGTTVWLRRKNA